MTILSSLRRWALHELQARRLFRWLLRQGAYAVGRAARIIPWVRVDRGIARYRSAIADNINGITERFINGQMDLATWQRRMAKEVKKSWLVSSMAGRGGRDAMTFADWGRTGGRLAAEYGYLNNFAQQIAAGELTPAQIAARANLYANASRTGFYDGLTVAMADAGKTEERRVLTAAEHCDDCIQYAGMGWQPIGSLPEPGEQSQCMRNCACYKEYR